MHPPYKTLTSCFFVVAASYSNAADLTPINITADKTSKADEASLSEASSRKTTSDLADALRQVKGVDASRMGGKGLDPVIRGQSQNRINVVLDGAYLYNACPNRMDPPTTYASLETYDNITVLKGNRSLIHGPGGNGGTILATRSRPDFEDKSWKADVLAGYTGNSDTRQYAADVATGSDQGYVRIISEYSKAGNYQDGDNQTVRSSYTTESNSVLLGYHLNDTTWVEGSVDQVREEDVLFAGAGMDSPYSDADTYRLSVEHQLNSSFATTVRAEWYRTEVDHLMDNYSLRTPSMMRMASYVYSDTEGGRLLFNSQWGGHAVEWGMDYQDNERTNGAVKQTGVFAQMERPLSANATVLSGIRMDWVNAKAHNANVADESERNLSAFAGFDYTFDNELELSTTLSRSVRTADVIERYQNTSRWVGTPDLDPETQHRLETMLSAGNDRFNWSVSAHYSDIDNYIERYQDGSVSRYDNIHAAIYGLDAEMRWQFHPLLGLGASLSWVKGRDVDNHDPLSQMPPLSSNIQLDYAQGPWNASLNWALVSQQSDVCLTGSSCQGLDLQKTPGYGLVDLNVGYDLSKQWRVQAGISNLLDKHYSNHLNRQDQFGNSVQVTEPGRTPWLTVSGRF